MRKIIITEFISLDGVIESPVWSLPYWNDEISNFKEEEQQNAGSMLLGRVTYEGFAAAWPQSEDEGADFMNNMPKYLVTTTLKTPEWNNTHVISENVVEAMQKLKQEDGKDILVYGSSVLSDTLLKHGLVDSVRFLMYPVIVGEGQKFFKDGTDAKLKLVSSQTLSGGVLALVYEPEK